MRVICLEQVESFTFEKETASGRESDLPSGKWVTNQ